MTLRKSSFVINGHPNNINNGKIFYYFNTLSRKFISLPQNIETIIGHNNLKILELLRIGHWITDTHTYDDEMENVLDLITKAGTNSEVLNIIFTITTKCNLKCGYCFQNNAMRIDASETVMKALPVFMKAEVASRPKINKVRLGLFGGEPLLMKTQCLGLLDSIKKECSSASLQFEGGIVTNGLGADSAFWQATKGLGLRHIQVTVDGAEQVHDAFRHLDGAGTYRQILSQYSCLSDDFNVSLKYNLSRQSTGCFPEFIADLSSHNFNMANTRVILEAMKSTDYNEIQPYYFNMASEDLRNAYISCASSALHAGWKVSLTHMFQPPCMYTQEKSSTILICPDGHISRCISVYTDDPDFTDGNITEQNATFSTRNIKSSILRNMTKCKSTECPFFPVCMTGCPSYKKMKFKRIDTLLCNYNHLASIVEGLYNLYTKQQKEFKLLDF